MNILISIFLIVGAFAIAILASNRVEARPMPDSFAVGTTSIPVAIQPVKGRIPTDVANSVLNNVKL